MPDDERNRRRLGDATRERIAGLAEGWSVDAPDPAAPAAPAAAAPAAGTGPRKKPRTVPPPPPGSAERKALEEAIVEVAKATPAPTPTRSKPVTAPPPARAKPVTVPPSIPPLPASPARTKPPSAAPPAAAPALPLPPPPAPARTKPPTPPPPPRPKAPTGAPPPRPAAAVAPEHTPPVIVDDSLTIPGAPPPEARSSDPNLVVPVGEFDSGIGTIEQGQLRAAHPPAHTDETIKRDIADALLKIPEVRVVRGDTTGVGGERGDPTAIESEGERGDATVLQGPSDSRTSTGGRLRAHAALRRQRGLLGDARYVITATLGTRRVRRELASLEQRQAGQQASRRRHLVTLGRTAVVTDSFEHPALVRARDALAAVEDERSLHAGAVAASDSELARVRRDREAKVKQHAADVARCEAELAELARKLEPLEKEAAVARKRADELRAQLARIDRQLADTEAKLVSVKADKLDPAGIQAELATLRADRRAVARDEPKLAAELDALNPRIASIEAARAEAQKRRRELDVAEAEDQRRTAELLEAIGAKRKVVERAASEAEAARDKVLFELGERLYVDRPAVLAAQLAPIDAIDLELGESDRRVMELKEILANVDRAKLARGVGVITLVFLLVAGLIAWFAYLAG